MSRRVRKPPMLVLARSDTNQAVQPLKMARGSKFCIKEEEVLYYPRSENKGSDQSPQSFEKTLVGFLMTRLIWRISGVSVISMNTGIIDPSYRFLALGCFPAYLVSEVVCVLFVWRVGSLKG